jgi:hypothetical protein
MHLDEQRHAELLAGTLRGEPARALARHLEAGCDTCEGFLAGRARTDGLDGRVDRALAALAAGAAGPRPAPGENGARGEDPFERVERRLAGDAPPAPSPEERRLVPARRRRARPWLPLAAAAAVLAAGLAALALRGARPAAPAWDGVKGVAPEGAAAAPVAVRLRFVVVEGEGSAARLRRAESGERVPAAAGLQFEVELARPAHVTLVRVPPRGAPEPFFEGALAPGASLVAVDGRPAVYRLDGLEGPQRFVALAADEPLGPVALARALADRRSPEGEVEIRVE